MTLANAKAHVLVVSRENSSSICNAPPVEKKSVKGRIRMGMVQLFGRILKSALLPRNCGGAILTTSLPNARMKTRPPAMGPWLSGLAMDSLPGTLPFSAVGGSWWDGSTPGVVLASPFDCAHGIASRLLLLGLLRFFSSWSPRLDGPAGSFQKNNANYSARPLF